MSDSNAVRLAWVRESVENTIPATPVFRRLRYTGAPDLAGAPVTTESEEILDDGQLSDLIVVARNVGGSVDFEPSYGAHDTFLEAAIRGTWQTRTTKTQALGLNVADANTINMSDTSGLAVADLVATENYGTAVNNGLFQVAAVSAGVSIDVTLVGGGATSLVAETAPATAVLRVVGRLYTGGITIGTPAGGQAVLTGVSTNFTSLSLEAGDWIRLGGYATLANNGYVRIVSITSATVMTVDRLPTGFAAEAGASGNRIFFGERLKNEIARYSYTLQELFTDIGTAPNNTRQLLSGMGLNTLSLSVTSEQVLTGQMSFIGQSSSYATAPIAGETFTEAERFTPYNASADVARIGEAGTTLTANLPTEMTIEINNNLAKRPAIGRIGGAGFRRGQFSVSGTLNTYFDDKSLVEKVINNTETGLDLVINDTASHAVVLDFPRVKYATGAPPVPGRNQDVLASLEWRALKHQTLNYTMKVMRFHRVA